MTDTYPLLLEYGAYNAYQPCRNMAEVDQFRKETGAEGTLYTHDGHLVNEENWRKWENDQPDPVASFEMPDPPPLHTLKLDTVYWRSWHSIVRDIKVQ